jgi:hypothetical protein
MQFKKIKIKKFNNTTGKKYLRESGIEFKTSDKKRIEPNYADLSRLYYLVQNNHFQNIMEFGVGFSTEVICAAINEKKIGNVVSIDSSKKWIQSTKKLLTNKSLKKINFHYSGCSIIEINNTFASIYDTLPNITPDLIYLDGPDPNTVKGSVRGCDFKEGRFVMSADILFIEPYLKPMTTILVDGRTLNARFLEKNLRRNWIYHEDFEDDFSIFYLDEKPLRSQI